jgi:hypothetical protein
MTNEINNLGMIEPAPELTINTEKKQTKSILSPALRAANALNKMKDIGKKLIELPISKNKINVWFKQQNKEENIALYVKAKKDEATFIMALQEMKSKLSDEDFKSFR